MLLYKRFEVTCCLNLEGRG